MSGANMFAQIKTILQGMALFADSEVSIGDDRIATAGISQCAIIYPAEVTIADEYQNREKASWAADIILMTKVSGDPATDWAAFVSARDAVIDELMKWPLLGQTSVVIDKITIAARDKPSFLNDSDGNGPFFIMQIITVTPTEIIEITGGDY